MKSIAHEDDSHKPDDEPKIHPVVTLNDKPLMELYSNLGGEAPILPTTKLQTGSNRNEGIDN